VILLGGGEGVMSHELFLQFLNYNFKAFRTQMAHKQLMDMISSLKERESDCVVEEREEGNRDRTRK